MSIKVIPHSKIYTSAVEAFNIRMREGGSKWGFYLDPIPDWIPPTSGAKTWREYHLAVEDGEIVRGGYALKPQEWYINGVMEWVTDWQGPFTEAAIDVKYSPLMLRLMRGMLKEHPLLFSLGHGGTDEPMVDLLRKMGWDLWPVPFSFYITKPFNFLRLNKYLRSSALRRIALNTLAFTGAGYVGVKCLQLWNTLTNKCTTQDSHVEVVSEFGAWADDLWDAHKESYSCLAVRDQAMMNTLFPQGGWPGGVRLKITSNAGNVIGWSVVHSKQFEDDVRFGALKVGLITDCFGGPDAAGSIMEASHRYLESQGVDMIFANLSHPAWNAGLQSIGYNMLENRRIFAVSPELQNKLSPQEMTAQGLHLTNMDGHGPHGFQ